LTRPAREPKERTCFRLFSRSRSAARSAHRLRYLAGIWVVRMLGHTPFPVAILSVNVVGSFLMGLFIGAAAHGV
jgi:fluoride ion exporter CrcB/FEX